MTSLLASAQRLCWWRGVACALLALVGVDAVAQSPHPRMGPDERARLREELRAQGLSERAIVPRAAQPYGFGPPPAGSIPGRPPPGPAPGFAPYYGPGALQGPSAGAPPGFAPGAPPGYAPGGPSGYAPGGPSGYAPGRPPVVRRFGTPGEPAPADGAMVPRGPARGPDDASRWPPAGGAPGEPGSMSPRMHPPGAFRGGPMPPPGEAAPGFGPGTSAEFYGRGAEQPRLSADERQQLRRMLRERRDAMHRGEGPPRPSGPDIPPPPPPPAP